MRDQTPCHSLAQRPNQQRPIVGFDNSAGYTAIRAYQVNDVARQWGKIASARVGIDDHLQRLFDTVPTAAGDVRQDIVEMRVTSKRRHYEKCQLWNRHAGRRRHGPSA